MLPEAKHGDLLYVSTYDDNELHVFSFPRGTSMGRLSGFNHIGGLCTDPAGNIWIGDYDKMLEYGHGGTQPIKTLKNPMPSAFIGSCSVDPTTGNLAISNTPDGSDYGNVGVYENAEGSPRYYELYKPQQCSYDGTGDLYCDTHIEDSFLFGLYKLPAKKQQFAKVSLNKSIVEPGGMQWDGRYLMVGDAETNVVHRFHVHGRKGRSVGSLLLSKGNWVNEFSIARSKLAGANYDGRSVMIWPFPRGGKPVTTIPRLDAIGVTVSLAPH